MKFYHYNAGMDRQGASSAKRNNNRGVFFQFVDTGKNDKASLAKNSVYLVNEKCPRIQEKNILL